MIYLLNSLAIRVKDSNILFYIITLFKQIFNTKNMENLLITYLKNMY